MSDGWVARGHTEFVIDYESPYVVYPPEGHTYIHGSLVYQDAAAKLAVDKAISQA
jgi:hypothetical protein